MEAWDTIRARRAVRSFADRSIGEDDLDRILEAGRRAPSSMNEQRWDFVVVSERNRLQQLAKVWRYGGHVASSAATVAFVTPESDDGHERESIAFDLGQTVMSMMIAAADLGIGSCHSSVHDTELARSLLGFPSDRRCNYLVAFGYPADRPLRPIRSPNRRALDEVVHRDRW